MLAVNNLTYFIGGRPLYQNASLHIKPKNRIGLIGLNGTGKSTLLRLIVGEYLPDGGSISKSNECTIGFLNQDLLSYQTDDSILSVAMMAFKEAVEVQKKIEKVLYEMEHNYTDELVDKLAKLQHQFEDFDGYTMQAKAEEILEGIGFKTEELHKPLRQFSGGWRMRVMLAKLLLEKPSLLLLDEPTNHLDLPSIEWVENYLKGYEGSVVIVSHDRFFLDKTVNMIVEVTNQDLVTYAGNYTDYLEEKELRRDIQKGAFENQQAKIKQTEKFIERFKAKATKARQVQSRVKALDRMDVIDDVVDENAVVNFKFRFNTKPGRFIMTLKDVSKAYGPLQILKNTNAIIERGDKIALIGANGKGKSTLLRIISGDERIEGSREMGHNVRMSFFAQHQLESLNVNNEILEELKQAGTDKTDMELRGVLGCFLFTSDDVFKKIKVLSGGEKSRVALAKTLISESNFLLLDEPTNHLDIQSENILIQALQQYEGTFVIVSHNRYFVTNVATKIWYIEDQEIKQYPGTYEEYDIWREKNNKDKVVQNAAPAKPKQEAKPVVKQLSAEESIKKAENEKMVKKKQKDLEAVEQHVTLLEQKVNEAEEQLAKTEIFSNPDKLFLANQLYEKLKSELQNKNDQWETLVMEIEELKA